MSGVISNWQREPFRMAKADLDAAFPPPPLLRSKDYRPRPPAGPRQAPIVPRLSRKCVNAATTTPRAATSNHQAAAISDLKSIVAKLLADGAALGGDAPAMGETWVRQYLASDVVLRDRVADELLAQCIRTVVTRALTQPST